MRCSWTIAITMLFKITFVSANVIAVGDSSATLVIGKPFPKHIFRNLLNYHEKSLSTNSFIGKWTILDFWGTFCVPCVAGIPKLEALHKSFSASLQIFLVGVDGEPKIKNFVNRMNKQGHEINLPIIIDDGFSNQLQINSVPQEVWIDDKGIVQAISDYEYITESNIRIFLKNEYLDIPDITETSIPRDSNKPFLINGNGGNGETLAYHSVLTKYVRGLYGSHTFPDKGRGTKINVFNSPIRALYMVACGDSNGQYPYSRILLEMKDTTRARFNHIGNFEVWKLENEYCYELIVPESKKDSLLSYFRADLDRYFGLKVKKEFRTEPCWILHEIDISKLKTKGGKKDYKFDVTGIGVANQPMSELWDLLWYFHQKEILIDETTFKGNVDIDLNCNMLDMNDLNIGLRKYGIEFRAENRQVEMLILSDY